MDAPSPTPASTGGFGAGARAVTAANVAILAGLAFAVLVALNLVVSRAYTRWDWTSAGAMELSEKTRTFLHETVDTQEHPVRVYVFYPAPSAYRLSTRRDEVYAVHHLARELDIASPNILIETLDPEQNRGRVDQLRRDFDITDVEFSNGVVAFEFRGKRKYVTDPQIFEVDIDAMRAAGGGKEMPKRFHGEDRFLGAIQGLVLGKTPQAAILVGHGELNPKAEDPQLSARRLETALRRDTFEVDVLDLKGHSVIRKDYDVICILGPRQPLPPTAITALRGHLERGGGLLVAAAPNIDPRPSGAVVCTPTGLEELLAEWGIHLDPGTDLVVASAADPTGRQMQFSEFFAPTFDAEHPVTQAFTYTRGRIIPFAHVRSVRFDDQGRNRTQGWTLAKTDANGRRITDFVAYRQAARDPLAERAFLEDPQRHPPGEQTVAAASETLRPASGTGQPTRVVVFGSASWCDDAPPYGAYDTDLFVSAANWIARRDTLVGIGAKDPTKVRFAMSESQKDLVFWLGVVFLPFAVGILGAMAWWLRKREAVVAPAPAAEGAAA